MDLEECAWAQECRSRNTKGEQADAKVGQRCN
jgi:hypothetical protein